jgi:hypothetical protein
MEIVLQMWGGVFYLLAKVFLAHAEGKENSKWRVLGWVIYLLGIPPWAIVLAQNHNWIAMAVEIGGAPAIILGITIAIKKLKKIPNLIDQSIKLFVWMLIIIGFLYSIYDFKGINNFSQILELGVTVGFLMGTYLLAKKERTGWLYFLLMNTSMGLLMAIQGKWIFAILQVVSIFFVIYGFTKSRKIKNNIIIN